MADSLPPSEQLVAFKTVVEQGSFTAAADHLNLTQSAVSHQIAKLERRWGRRLMERSSRGLVLTTEGDSLYQAIRGPMETLLATFVRPDGQSLPARTLRIQVEPVFASAWLTSRLEDFLFQHPNLQLEQYIVSPRRIPDSMDLAIKWGLGNWANMESEPLLALSYTPVCAPALVRNAGISTPEDLCRQVLLHDSRAREWELWFKKFGLVHPRVRRGHVVDDSHILIEMAATSRGVAILSPLLMGRELASGELVCPFPDMSVDLTERYHIVTHAGRTLSRDTQAFIAWLRQQAKQQAVALAPGNQRLTPS